jgi:hypothetical protein
MGKALAEWVRSGEPPPLLFSDDEWRASADVFPLEIEDMRDAHRVIRGRDPLAGVATSRDDLRRQLEREVRGKLLHLRTEYAASAEDGRALGRLLENSLGTVLVLCRATLRVTGRVPPADPAALVRETAAVAGLDPAAFEWALSRRAGGRVPSLAAFDPRGTRYVDQVEQLARFVNQL